MVWTQIKKIEKSQYENGSYLAFFDMYGRERFVIITKKVLEYLEINSLKKGDEIFVIRSFNKTGDERFLIKQVQEGGIENA